MELFNSVLITQIKNLVQIAFFIVMIIVAIYGLNLWRRELKGKTEFEIARNVLVATLRLRDAVISCQSGWMYPTEYADRIKQENEGKAETEILNSFHAYNKRFNMVLQERNKLYSYQIEAEALFGAGANEIISELLKVVNKLKASIELYHQFRLQNLGDKEEMKKFRNILFGISPTTHPNLKSNVSDDDNFRQSLDNAISIIHDYFQKKVKKD